MIILLKKLIDFTMIMFESYVTFKAQTDCARHNALIVYSKRN